ncbi:uncharacterized protein V6R79_000663 [Siganus canaliculatus]
MRPPLFHKTLDLLLLLLLLQTSCRPQPAGSADSLIFLRRSAVKSTLRPRLPRPRLLLLPLLPLRPSVRGGENLNTILSKGKQLSSWTTHYRAAREAMKLFTEALAERNKVKDECNSHEDEPWPQRHDIDTDERKEPFNHKSGIVASGNRRRQ